MTQSNPPPGLAHGITPARGRDASPVREHVEELTKRLRSEHDEFERASQSWTTEAEEQKREARKAREATLKEIQEVLASGGEAERAARIERLPFARKLIELEAWVGGTAPRPSQPVPAPAPSIPAPRASAAPPVPPPAPAPPTSTSTSASPAPPAAASPAPADPWARSRPAVAIEAQAPSSGAAGDRALPILPSIGSVRRKTIGLRVGAGLVAAAVVVAGWLGLSHRDPAGDAAAVPAPAAASQEPTSTDPTAGQTDPAPSATAEAPNAQPETLSAPATPRHPLVAPITHARPRPKASQPPAARSAHPHEAPTNPY